MAIGFLRATTRYKSLGLSFSLAFVLSTGFLLAGSTASLAYEVSASDAAPAPLLKKGGKPVVWWFVFKFNAGSFPGCANQQAQACTFGGDVQDYPRGYGQQYVYSSSEDAALHSGPGCVGESENDPVAATFDEVYNGNYYYVVWNDQFHGDPISDGPAHSGHSKGVVAWNDSGEGFVMQVSTPSWPGSGSASSPRGLGNTLGCIAKDDNVMVSQHFFALRLTKSDLITVLQAMQNASIVTDTSNIQIVRNGGPKEVADAVDQLGQKSDSTKYTIATLSTGAKVISKPYTLHVPPWQFVSATLNGVPLLTATWWSQHKIEDTAGDTQFDCWDDSLGQAGAVQIAHTGHWRNKTFGLEGGPSKNRNHAKIGVSTDSGSYYTIFGDMNQEGSISGTCDIRQNGRGGMFFVLTNKKLNEEVTSLLSGN